jgi:diaminohydroxyphosphoribosylaminopyrimidine deaminase/5-amino-6-(5-phosphoribosylamino)uracil reductase
MPARMVMSRTLDLPADANLWDVDSAPTIVMTQRGARASFQALLRARGVEVVEFDFLTPENVADYCYERGFLQVGEGGCKGVERGDVAC